MNEIKRQSMFARYQLSCERALGVPAAWYEAWDGIIRQELMAEMIFSKSVVSLARMKELADMDSFIQAGSSKNWVARTVEPRVLELFGGVTERIEETFPVEVRWNAFVLSLAYSIDDVVKLPAESVSLALFVASRDPGSLLWETVLNWVDADVDLSLVESFLDGAL
jgi:hypothetical protein